MFSGKDTLFKITKEYVGGEYVQKLAAADKLKLVTKEFLCLVARYRNCSLKENPLYRKEFDEFTRKVSADLFDTDELVPKVAECFKTLSSKDYVLAYAIPPARMPLITREFGFDDIDKLLWADCGKPRQMLQELGTDYMRGIKDSVWLDYAYRIARRNPDYFFCMTDCRFLNEVSRCKQESFLDIRVEATESVRSRRSFERDGQDLSEFEKHRSETGLDEYPFTIKIDNDGSVEELRTNMFGNKAIRDLLLLLKRRSARQLMITCF